MGRYVVQPNADGAKPMSEMEFNVVDTKKQLIVFRDPSEAKANEVCTYLNQAANVE